MLSTGRLSTLCSDAPLLKGASRLTVYAERCGCGLRNARCRNSCRNRIMRASERARDRGKTFSPHSRGPEMGGMGDALQPPPPPLTTTPAPHTHTSHAWIGDGEDVRWWWWWWGRGLAVRARGLCDISRLPIRRGEWTQSNYCCS